MCRQMGEMAADAGSDIVLYQHVTSIIYLRDQYKYVIRTSHPVLIFTSISIVIVTGAQTPIFGAGLGIYIPVVAVRDTM